METRTTIVEGVCVRCEAEPYSYPLGVGVSIELFIEERGVAKVLVLCSANFPEFPELSSLPESDRIRLAIDDFAGNRLNTTAASALKWPAARTGSA